MDITFGLKDERALNRTISEENTAENALLRISETHGWTSSYQARKEMSFDSFKDANYRTRPVIMERNGNTCFCFGYASVDGKQVILLANPEQMPFQVGRPLWAKEDVESLDWRVTKTCKN